MVNALNYEDQLEFKSHTDFENFEKHVRCERRYVHSGPVVDFFSALSITLPDRTRLLAKNSVLYRAQIGFEEIEMEGEIMITGFKKERMKPNREFCGEGRANPRGIPYLYLSNELNTCMAELRPQRGQMLSVADFVTRSDLKVVDCYSVERDFGDVELIFSPPTTQEGIRSAIWSHINKAFSKPVSLGDSSSDYIPTQVLVEFFRHYGYDGVCFKSGLGVGHNYVLFDLAAADLVSCGVYDVKAIAYDFAECTNRYYQRQTSPVAS